MTPVKEKSFLSKNARASRSSQGLVGAFALALSVTVNLAPQVCVVRRLHPTGAVGKTRAAYTGQRVVGKWQQKVKNPPWSVDE
ncbi:MAG: hypothetical protein CSA75_01195 [Sorangium cellulosum]|nr:MAG: hypothetical protein CSA75_01195 [Sorangium cellulosum]